MGVVVHIDKFSGPLGLLLHLIRQEEMDIFDINIHQITQQYLDSIKAMKKLNLEVAGDFIAMAATLIQIKSKMLLPQYDEHGEVIETEDPRRDLVKRLLEYQMFQEAGQNLYKRPLLGRDTWARGEREQIQVKDDEILLEEENALYSLISLYRGALKRMKKAVHRVAESLQSIADRIWEMRDRLVVGQRASFFELVDAGVVVNDGAVVAHTPERKGRLLITFLSLLELANIGLVNLFQSENYADIHVDTKGPISRDVISNVESYDGQAKENKGVQDIWLSDEDRQGASVAPESLEGLPSETGLQMSLAVPENPEVEAATDAEIEAEEAKYGQKEIEQI
jgi:segregation and condensation protein A